MRRKQRVSEDSPCDSPDPTYDMIHFTKGVSQKNEHGHKEAEIKMNMQIVLSTNIAYGCSLQSSTDVRPNEALYADVDTC